MIDAIEKDSKMWLRKQKFQKKKIRSNCTRQKPNKNVEQNCVCKISRLFNEISEQHRT